MCKGIFVSKPAVVEVRIVCEHHVRAYRYILILANNNGLQGIICNTGRTEMNV